ncbi:hypothetical protein BDI4_940011 [Burkholderia diffusa]|nr:hypothetical protein BDI4_940011 [Burkholderia diffusa]
MNQPKQTNESVHACHWRFRLAYPVKPLPSQ